MPSGHSDWPVPPGLPDGTSNICRKTAPEKSPLSSVCSVTTAPRCHWQPARFHLVRTGHLEWEEQRHHFADQDQYFHSYGFSRSHMPMWELDCKETWMLKNWCFWTVVLENTLENHSDCKEIQSVYLKGNQSWIFIGSTDAEAELKGQSNTLAAWYEELTYLKRPWCW